MGGKKDYFQRGRRLFLRAGTGRGKNRRAGAPARLARGAPSWEGPGGGQGGQNRQTPGQGVGWTQGGGENQIGCGRRGGGGGGRAGRSWARQRGGPQPGDPRGGAVKTNPGGLWPGGGTRGCQPSSGPGGGGRGARGRGRDVSLPTGGSFCPGGAGRTSGSLASDFPNGFHWGPGAKRGRPNKQGGGGGAENPAATAKSSPARDGGPGPGKTKKKKRVAGGGGGKL